ncbi:MAG: beta-ketoacyl-ACP synthase III [Myxococcales bacterium]|nr:MAG: beta-ketoacyl-ACP synthase III [Myxococcales bacterium]
MPNAIIIGTGSYLPPKRLANKELEQWPFVNSKGESYTVSSAEIVGKTGIRERRVAEEENTSDMAAEAGRRAIAAAGVHPDDVDLVLLATSTPDQKIPKTAPQVAAKIGLHGVPAYDFGKDCSGWIEALEAASYYIMAGRYEHILVIGADRCTSFINKSNKGTAVLFGDGAGAALLTATNDPNRGFLEAVAGSQGDHYDKLWVPVGGSALPYSPSLSGDHFFLKMDGKAIAGFASQVFAVGVERILAKRHFVPENLDLLIPHQANLRVIEAGAKALDLPMTKVVTTLETTGNTAAASVPIALDEAVRQNRLKPGYLLCLTGYGAGLSWIAALMRW